MLLGGPKGTPNSSMTPVEDTLERFQAVTESLPFATSIHSLYGGFRELANSHFPSDISCVNLPLPALDSNRHNTYPVAREHIELPSPTTLRGSYGEPSTVHCAAIHDLVGLECQPYRMSGFLHRD